MKNIGIYLFAVAAILLLSSGAFAALDTNLYAYYNFEETTNTTLIDRNGFDQNLTNHGPSLVQQSGRVGYAWQYNDTNTYQINNTFNSGHIPVQTISGWIYSTNYTAGAGLSHAIWSYRRDSDNWDVYTAYTDDQGRLGFTGSNNSTHTNFYFNTKPVNGTWNYVTLVIYDNNYVKGYLNGISDFNTNIAYAFNNTTTRFAMGTLAWNNNELYGIWNGKLDEFGVWKRELTQAEVVQLYNSGNGLTYPFNIAPAIADTNLSAYYNFNETSGTTLIDLVGGDNNGISQNVTINQAGKIGAAYAFTAPGVVYNMNKSMMNIGQKQFSINMWFKRSATATNTWILFGCGQTNNIDALMGYGANVPGEIGYTQWGSNAAITNAWTQDTAWHMVTITSGDTNTRVYMDGTRLNNNANSHTMADFVDACYFGFRGQYNDQYMEGTIDEASIWKRELSQSDVTALYNSGNGLTYPFTGGSSVGVVTADFNYIVNKATGIVQLKDNSTTTAGFIQGWSYILSDGNLIGTTKDFNYTVTELTDYNICLTADANTGASGTKCKTFNTGDWSAPTTTFSSYQKTNTSDQNITLTCTDANIGCYKTAYRIDGGSWVILADGNVLTKTQNFKISGAGIHTIDYNSTDVNLNVETTKSSSFITYGTGHFVFKDENSGLPLTGVTVTYNDINYVMNDFNFQGLSPFNITFKFYKSGYSMRQWQMDINQFTDFNKTILLLPDVNSANIAFQFYAPDQTTLLKNAYIDVNNNFRGGWTERIKTDNDGKAIFTLNSDSNNYFFNIVSETGTVYTYKNVVLTIARPKDEANGNDISGSWSYNISGGLAATADNNVQTDTKAMLVYGNTVLNYVITIDTNNIGNYEARTYYVRILGAANTYTLNPYLVLFSNSALIKFIAIDKALNKPIEGIDLGFYRIILGGKKLVANASTDITGSTIVSLTVGSTYSITLARNGAQFYSSDNFVVGSSPVYIYLTGSTVTVYQIDTNAPKLTWNPATDYMPAGTLGISQTITGSNLSWVRYQIYQYKDANMMTGRNILYTKEGSCAGGCVVSTLLNAFTYDGNKPFYFDTNVYTDSNASVTHFTKKFVGAPTKGGDLFGALRNVKRDMGCSLDSALPCGIGIVVSIIATLLIVAFLVFKFGITSPIPLIIVGLFLLGGFTFIEWMYLPLFALFAVGGIFSIYRGIVTAG